MVEIGDLEKAKYPFLPEAGRYLQEQSFTIEKLGRDPDLKPFVERAYRRIEIAAAGGIYRSDEEKQGYVLGVDKEIFSFLVAIILLKLSRSAALISKFVMAESRRAEQYLESDLKDPRGRREESIVKMIEDLFSISVQRENQDFVIPVADYVRHSVFFHEMPWKLVNRRVSRGMVLLTPHEVVRLIRQELNKYIHSKITSAKTPPMLDNFEKSVERLSVLARQFRSAPRLSTEYPPCIKHAIKVLEDGQNLPHSGRFMLASYLLCRGQSVEEVAPLFKNAPDYSEKVTLYQLNHIAGRAGADGYTCPSCDKIRGNDLCFAIPECDGIVNPLQFGRGSQDARA